MVTPPDVDLTGRDRIARNVLSSWAGQFVYVFAGFVMPRVIDDHVGQTALGVWDFAWSLVSYFGLAQIGVGVSVNRYVAKLRAIGDRDALSRMVSSVMAVQAVATVVVLIATVGTVAALDRFFGARLGDHLSSARWVVALLGFSLAVQMACDAFRGVITGCHRWDVHNLLNSGFYGVSVVGMLVALWSGGGLRAIAAVYLAGVVATEAARVVMAMRICPELRIRPSSANWADARTSFVYGGKGVIDGLAKLLLIQANNLLVASYMGPAALAQYARPGALVRQAENFLNKFAHVMLPTASSMKSSGRHEELREFLIDATRTGTYITLPMLLFLGIMADPILHVWMGANYREGRVLGILAAGYFLPLTQRPTQIIVAGMNLHGPVGLFSMAMAIAGIWLGNYLVGTQGWGLEGAALALAVATTIGNGVAIPVYACRMMSLRLGVYIRRAFGGPIVATAPFAISLLFIRIFQGESPWVALGLASICAVFVLGAVYWNWVVPLSLRQSLTRRFDVTRWVMRGPRKNIQPLNDPAVRGNYRRP